MKFIGLVIASLLWLSGCANNNDQTLAKKDQALREYIAANKLTEIDRVTSFRFHGWSSLTNDFLMISSSPKRNYLIELTGFCNDIRWAHTLVINRGDNSSLHARFDSVSTLDAPEIKCMIKRIYPLAKEQVTDIKLINTPAAE